MLKKVNSLASKHWSLTYETVLSTDGEYRQRNTVIMLEKYCNVKSDEDDKILKVKNKTAFKP